MKTMASRNSSDFPTEFSSSTKMTSDCCVFQFLQPGEGGGWLCLSEGLAPSRESLRQVFHAGG